MTKKISQKAIREIIALGRSQREGEAVVQKIGNRYDVNFYLGGSSFEGYGLSWDDAQKTVIYIESFDGDTPEYFRSFRRDPEAKQDYIDRTISMIEDA